MGICASAPIAAAGSTEEDETYTSSLSFGGGDDPLAEQSRIASAELYDACENGDLATVKLKLNHDEPDIHFQNDNDAHRTCLHAAVSGLGLSEEEENDGTMDRPAICRLLIEHGADIAAEDDDGCTPGQLVREDCPALASVFRELAEG